MQKTNIEEFNKIRIVCQSKDEIIEELKKQLIESKKEDVKQEANNHELTVEELEELHNESVEDVLKDAQNIKPWYSGSNWICKVIDKVTVNNI